jgi:tripartite-type tricarboxylate transporter receptor subunit TctC
MKIKWLAAAAFASAQLVTPAHAQSDYPAKAVNIIVPFSAGSLVDTIARLYSEKLSKQMGQAVVVENRVGSGGTIATQTMLNARADGYTVQMVSSSHAINPSLYALPYDTVKDTSCITMVASSPTVIAVRPGLTTTSVSDFVAYAKSKPGVLNYGSGGVGTAAHLAGAYFVSQTGTDIVHIPYKGVQEAVMEIVGGRIDLAFPPVSIAKPFMEANKLTGLAVTSRQRSPLLPNTPTAQEAGLNGFEYQIWYALIASAKTPPALLTRLAREMKIVGEMQKSVKSSLLRHCTYGC